MQSQNKGLVKRLRCQIMYIEVSMYIVCIIYCINIEIQTLRRLAWLIMNKWKCHMCECESIYSYVESRMYKYIDAFVFFILFMLRIMRKPNNQLSTVNKYSGGFDSLNCRRTIYLFM